MNNQNSYRISLHFNKITDKDIIEIIEKETNKQGYIKKLIRKELKNE